MLTLTRRLRRVPRRGKLSRKAMTIQRHRPSSVTLRRTLTSQLCHDLDEVLRVFVPLPPCETHFSRLPPCLVAVIENKMNKTEHEVLSHEDEICSSLTQLNESQKFAYLCYIRIRHGAEMAVNGEMVLYVLLIWLRRQTPIYKEVF
jgi:hypothetical protein